MVANAKSAQVYCKTVNRLAVILDQENESNIRPSRTRAQSQETVYCCNNSEDGEDSTQLSGFIHKLAELLDRAEKERVFDKLIIIAPTTVLNQMRLHFSSNTQQRIIAELNKNLTRLSERKLYDYLENILWF